MTQTFQKWKRGEGEKSTEKFGEEKEEKNREKQKQKKSSRFFYHRFFLGFLIFFSWLKIWRDLKKIIKIFFLIFPQIRRLSCIEKKDDFFRFKLFFWFFDFIKIKENKKLREGFFLQLIRVCNNEKGKRDVFNDFFFHSLFFHTVQIIYRCYSFFFWLYSHNWFFDSAFAWSSFIQKGSSRSL